MTDGWNWHQPDRSPTPAQPPGPAPSSAGPAPWPTGSAPWPTGSAPHPTAPTAWSAGSAGPTTGASPWWSDALSDPWRDPYAPSAVVLPAAAHQPGPAPEPVSDPDAAPTRGLRPVLLICLVSTLLAGTLGGALGYAFAVRGGLAAGQVLGAAPQRDANGSQRAPESLAGVAERVLPSVVTVRVAGGGGGAVGSGFVVTADGYVITNDHVVEGGSGPATVAFNDGSTATATVVGADAESDIAVIKVARAGLVPVEFGDSETIAVGDPVLAFGSPLALANTVTSGIVSALDRTIQAGEPGGQVRYYAAIQTDAAVNQGNSGGPLVDAEGRVVGVNSVIKSLAVDEEAAGNIGLAFAIPVNQAKRVAQDIIDTGKARRTVIGAEVGGTTARQPGGGVRLGRIESGGPAAAAGLKAGDVVTKIDGKPLEAATDLIALVRKYAPGSVVRVEYRRGAARQSASVTLAADAK